MPGPKPTPTAILENRGSWRAKDSSRAGEPRPKTAPKLSPPSWLKGTPSKIFNELGPKLHGAGLLTVADIPTFARYCAVYVAWRNAYDQLGKEPDRTAVLTLAKLDEMLRRLEANFGLSPADRTGITVEEQEGKNGKDRFFK